MNTFPTISLVLIGSLGVMACSAGGGVSDADQDAAGDGDASGDGDLSGNGAGGVGTGGAGPSGGNGGSGGGGPIGTGGAGSGGGSSTSVLFSSNFDSDALGKVMTGGSTWTTTLPTGYDSGGIVSIVGDKAHSGTQSVYVKKGNDGQAFLQLTDSSVFPFAGTKIHVRAYINVPEWPQNHVSWMEVGDPVNETSEMRIGAHQGVMQVNHWPGDQDQIAEGISFTPNAWHCIEYAYESATVGLEVWLNGTKVDALTVVGGVFARGGQVSAVPISALRFGAEIAATEAWFDDIAVSASPIGCD